MDNVIILWIIGGIVIVTLLLGWIPGHIAKSRGHVNADAINVAGWIGILFVGLIWFVALIWAYTGPDNGRQKIVRRHAPQGAIRRHRRRPVTAAADALDDLARS